MRRILAVLLLAAATSAAGAEGRAPAAGPYCSGEYADFLSSLRAENRAFETGADAGYTYCVRTTATYEHVYYGRGGKLRKQYIRHTRHGTGFAYKVKDGDWFLATNEHVAQHPDVTEADTEIEGVPAGSRKVRETVRIVRSESDDYEAGQIPLTKVLADEALDVAVLKTRHPLKLMPYRFGRSSALRVGNAVQVRGYPLGVFAASNTGKVISGGQIDRERGWNHEDFAVDALLNSGNSGSPVFAVSCRTGELELVGIYHAGYRDAQGLNVVVSIDQLKDLLDNLRLSHRDAPQGDGPVDRKQTLAALSRAGTPFLMPFGERLVRVDAEGRTVRFALLEPEYPLSSRVHLALVDGDGDLGIPTAVVLPPRFADQEIPWGALDAAVKEPAQRLYDGLWRQLAAVLEYRDLEVRGRGPTDGAALAQLSARVRSRKGEQHDLLQSIDFESDSIAWPALTPADGGHAPGAPQPTLGRVGPGAAGPPDEASDSAAAASAR